MLVLIGYAMIVGCVLGGFLIDGGHLQVLMQPVELMIIGGSAIAAFLIGAGGKTAKATLKALPTLLRGSAYTKQLYMETLLLLSNLFGKARREGLLGLEAEVEDIDNSAIFQAAPKFLKDHHATVFLTDYLRMAAAGQLDPHEMDNLMDLEIETHHHEAMGPVDALRKLADGLPAFGIVAAVLGVVHTMQSVDQPPPVLGELIGAALIGTFLGILLAYGFVGPLANLLEQRVTESSKHLECLKAGLLAFVGGSAPQVAVEFARKVIYPSIRPGFEELEEHLKENKLT